MKKINEDDYKKAIEECKKIISSNKQSQFKVAKIALDVCEIKHGGKKDGRGLFTVIDFAEKIGVSHKSLSQWINAYRAVYLKLDKNLQKKVVYTRAQDLSFIVKPDETSKSVMSKYKKLYPNNKPSLEYRLLKYGRALRALCTMANNGSLMCLEESPMLNEINFYAKHLAAELDKLKIKPIENKSLGGKASVFIKKWNNDKPESGHFLLKGGIQQLISEKEIRALYYLKNKGEQSPTSLGVAMNGGLKNKGSAKAWAIRCLNKLQNVGAVERLSGGYYRAVK